MTTSDPGQGGTNWQKVAQRHRNMARAVLGSDDRPSSFDLSQQEMFNLSRVGRDKSEKGFWEGVFTDATGDFDPLRPLPFLGTISEAVGSDRLDDAFMRFSENKASRDDIERISKYLEWSERESTALSNIGAITGQVGAFMGENAITMGVLGSVGKVAKIGLDAKRAALLGRIAEVGIVKGSLNAGRKFGTALKSSAAGRGAAAVLESKVGSALNTVLIKTPAAMAKGMVGADTLTGAAGMLAGKELIAQTGGVVTGLLTSDDAGYGAGRAMNAAHLRYLQEKYSYDVSQYGLEVVANNDLSLLEFMPRALFEQYIENWTEQVGGSLTVGIAALNKAINSQFIEKVILKNAAGEGLEAGARRVFERVASTGYNGVVQENFEEILGATATQLAGEITGDEEWSNTYKEFWTAQNWLEMSAGIALGSGVATRGAAAFQGAMDSWAGGASGTFRREAARGRKLREELAQAAIDARNNARGTDDDSPQANVWRGTPEEEGTLRKGLLDGYLLNKAEEELALRQERGETGLPTAEEMLANERTMLEAKYGAEADAEVDRQIHTINNMEDGARQRHIDQLTGATPAEEEAPMQGPALPEEAPMQGPQLPLQGPPAPQAAAEAEVEAEPEAQPDKPRQQFFEGDTRFFDEDAERPGVVSQEAQERDREQYAAEAAAAQRDLGGETLAYDELDDNQKRLVNIAFRNNKSVTFATGLDGVAEHDRATGRIRIDASKAPQYKLDVSPDGTVGELVPLTPEQSVEANFLHEGFHRLVRKFGRGYTKFVAEQMDKVLPGIRARNQAQYESEHAAWRQRMLEQGREVPELSAEDAYEEGVTRTLESFVGYMGLLTKNNDLQGFQAILEEQGTGLFRRVVDAIENGLRAAAFLGPKRQQSVTNLRNALADVEALGDLSKLSDEQLVRSAAIVQDFFEAWRGAGDQQLDSDEANLLGWRQDIASDQQPISEEPSAELLKARQLLAKLEAQLSVQESKQKNKLNEKKRKDLVRRVNKARRKVDQLEKAEAESRERTIAERAQRIQERAGRVDAVPQQRAEAERVAAEGRRAEAERAAAEQQAALVASQAEELKYIDERLPMLRARRQAVAGRTDARSRKLVQAYDTEIDALMQRQFEILQQGPTPLPSTEVGPQLPVQGPAQLPATEIGPQFRPSTEFGPQLPVQGPPLPNLPVQGPPLPNLPVQGPPRPVGMLSNAELDQEWASLGRTDNPPRQIKLRVLEQMRGRATQTEVQAEPEVQAEGTMPPELLEGERELGAALAFARGTALAEDLGFENVPWSEIEQELEDKSLQEELSPKEQMLLEYGPMMGPDVFDLWMERDAKLLEQRDKLRRAEEQAQTDPRNDKQHNLPRFMLGRVGPDGRLQFNLHIPAESLSVSAERLAAGERSDVVEGLMSPVGGYNKSVWWDGMMKEAVTAAMQQDQGLRVRAQFWQKQAASVGKDARKEGSGKLLELSRNIEALGKALYRDLGKQAREAFVQEYADFINKLNLRGQRPSRQPGLTPKEVAESMLPISDFASTREVMRLHDGAPAAARRAVDGLVSREKFMAYSKDAPMLFDAMQKPELLYDIVKEALVADALKATEGLVTAAATGHAIELFTKANPTLISPEMAKLMTRFYVQRAAANPGLVPMVGASPEGFDINKEADRAAAWQDFLNKQRHRVTNPDGSTGVLVHSGRSVFKEGVPKTNNYRPFFQATLVDPKQINYQLEGFYYFVKKSKARADRAAINPSTGFEYDGKEALGYALVGGYKRMMDYRNPADRTELAENTAYEAMYRKFSKPGYRKPSDIPEGMAKDILQEISSFSDIISDAHGVQGPWANPRLYKPSDGAQFEAEFLDIAGPQSPNSWDRNSGQEIAEWTAVVLGNPAAMQTFNLPHELDNEAAGIDRTFLQADTYDAWKAWVNAPGAFQSVDWWLSPETRTFMRSLAHTALDSLNEQYTPHPDTYREQDYEWEAPSNWSKAEHHNLVKAIERSGADAFMATEDGYEHYSFLNPQEQLQNIANTPHGPRDAVQQNIARGISVGAATAPFAAKPKSKLDMRAAAPEPVGPAFTQAIYDPTGRAISKTVGVVSTDDGGLQYIAELTHEEQAHGVFAVETPEVPLSMRRAAAQHMLHYAMDGGAEHISVSDPELAQTIAELSGAEVLEDGLIRLDSRVYERAGEQYNLGRMKAARNRMEQMTGRRIWSDNDRQFNLERDTTAPASRADADARTDYERVDAMMTTYLAGLDRNVHYTNLLSQQHEEALVASLPEGASEKEKAAHVKRVGAAIHLWIDMKGNDAGMSFDQLVAKYRADLKAKGMTETAENKQMLEDALTLSGPALVLAEKIAQQNLEFGQRLVAAGLLKNAREYYSARLWFMDAADAEGKDFTDPSVGAIEPTRPGGRFLTGLGGRAKKRVYNSILDGWAEGRKLTIDNAIVAQHKVMRDGNEAVANAAFAKVLQASGAIVKVKAGQRPPEGYVKINSNSRSFDGMYALPQHAHEFGALTTRFSWEGFGRAGRALRHIYNFQARAKSTLLFTSLFHHQAFMRSYFYSVPNAMDQVGDIYPLARASFQSLYNPQAANQTLLKSKAARQGWDAIMSFHPDVDILVANGLTLSMGLSYSLKAEYDQQWRRTFVESMAGKVSPRAGEFLANKRVASSNFLFGKMGTALKAQAALLEYRHMLHQNKDAISKGEITPNQIAAIVAEKTNDDFGGLNLRRGNQIIGGARRPGAQLLMRTFFLAPDWTESNFNTMWKAFGIIPRAEDKEERSAIGQAQYEKQRELQSRAYMTMYAQAMVRSQAITLAFNALMAGLDDEETLVSLYGRSLGTAFEDAAFGVIPKDFNFLKADITLMQEWFDEMMGAPGSAKHAGSRVYFNVLGHFLDPANWVSAAMNRDLTAPVKGKMGPFARAIAALVTGEDWRGMSYTSPSEMFVEDPEALGGWRMQLSKWEFGSTGSKLQGLPSMVIDQVTNNLPIFAQSGFRLAVGEDSAFDFLSDFFGFHTTRDYDRPAGGSSARGDFVMGKL